MSKLAYRVKIPCSIQLNVCISCCLAGTTVIFTFWWNVFQHFGGYPYNCIHDWCFSWMSIRWSMVSEAHWPLLPCNMPSTDLLTRKYFICHTVKGSLIRKADSCIRIWVVVISAWEYQTCKLGPELWLWCLMCWQAAFYMHVHLNTGTYGCMGSCSL